MSDHYLCFSATGPIPTALALKISMRTEHIFLHNSFISSPNPIELSGALSSSNKSWKYAFKISLKFKILPRRFVNTAPDLESNCGLFKLRSYSISTFQTKISQTYFPERECIKIHIKSLFLYNYLNFKRYF